MHTLKPKLSRVLNPKGTLKFLEGYKVVDINTDGYSIGASKLFAQLKILRTVKKEVLYLVHATGRDLTDDLIDNCADKYNLSEVGRKIIGKEICESDHNINKSDISRFSIDDKGFDFHDEDDFISIFLTKGTFKIDKSFIIRVVKLVETMEDVEFDLKSDKFSYKSTSIVVEIRAGSMELKYNSEDKKPLNIHNRVFKEDTYIEVLHKFNTLNKEVIGLKEDNVTLNEKIESRDEKIGILEDRIEDLQQIKDFMTFMKGDLGVDFMSEKWNVFSGKKEL